MESLEIFEAFIFIFVEVKNYYVILGLHIYATHAEIKRAYRKLAFQYHPDRNKSPEAEAIFKEINEAYECLDDPVRKFMYDQMLHNAEPQLPVEEAEERKHRDPRYKPQPKGAAPRAKRPTHREEILAMMASNLKYAQIISRLTLMFSAILITDFSLPAVKSKVEIVGGSTSDRGTNYKLELDGGKTVGVSREAARNLVKAKAISIYRSAFFSIPLALEDEQTHYRTKVNLSIYGSFIFWPILLLLTSLAGTFYWKGVEFRFNVAIVNAILFLLNLVFLQVHKF
jgi:curved DNA-binding protein CbpA